MKFISFKVYLSSKLNSFKVLCLDRMFGVLPLIPPYLHNKIPRNELCSVSFGFRKKFKKICNTLTFFFGDKNEQ